MSEVDCDDDGSIGDEEFEQMLAELQSHIDVIEVCLRVFSILLEKHCQLFTLSLHASCIFANVFSKTIRFIEFL